MMDEGPLEEEDDIMIGVEGHQIEGNDAPCQYSSIGGF